MRRLFIIILLTLTYTSISGQCKCPIHVSADSLVSTMKSDWKKKYNQKTFFVSDSLWKQRYYDNSKGIKYDTAYRKCQDYLIMRLGKSVYCKYIELGFNSFTYGRGAYRLAFDFQLPNAPKEHHVEFEFKLYLQPDSSLIITYPKNVPECNGLPNCGFVISKDSAVSIAKKNNFLTDKQQYNIEPDGVNWVIDSDVTTIRVNIQTGKATMQKGFRID